MVLTQAWRRGHSTNKDLQHAQLEEWNLFCSFQAKSFQYGVVAYGLDPEPLTPNPSLGINFKKKGTHV